MKKFTSLFCFILSFALLLTACNGPKQDDHPIELLRQKLEAAGSYQMTFVFREVPEIGEFSAMVKTDGNKTYTEDAEGQVKQYTEKVGETLYLYTATPDGWQKATYAAEQSNAFLSQSDFDALFDKDNYDVLNLNEKRYALKDSVSLEGIDAVILTVTDDGCILSARITYGGLSMQALITLDGIGSTSVTLPTVP